MPRGSPFTIILAEDEKQILEGMARQYTSPYFQVIRSKIILLAAEGLSNKRIAERLDIPRQIVSKWRKRFFEDRLAGMEDQPRSGRPASFSPQVVVQVKALACELPSLSGLPLSRFSNVDIASEAIRRGIAASISGATVWRWLNEDAIRPWQYRSWIFPRDPEFKAKAGRVLDLYHRQWNGKPLGPREYVLCADEKTSIQARIRRRPTQPPGQRRAMRVEHEYTRGGSLAYLAAMDVHRAKIFGHCEPHSGIEPFDRLIAQLMRRQPYRSARRIYLIIDNGSVHRGKKCIDRIQAKWPKIIPIHLPIHASWLNQIEIYFSIV